MAVKDNICTRDMPTTCGSRILESFASPYNASVVEDLQKSGAVLAGKTNMDEFGMGCVNKSFPKRCFIVLMRIGQIR